MARRSLFPTVHFQKYFLIHIKFIFTSRSDFVSLWSLTNVIKFFIIIIILFSSFFLWNIIIKIWKLLIIHFGSHIVKWLNEWMSEWVVYLWFRSECIVWKWRWRWRRRWIGLVWRDTSDGNFSIRYQVFCQGQDEVRDWIRVWHGVSHSLITFHYS